MLQPFNAIIKSIVLKRFIHYLFYAPPIGIYILEISSTDGLVMLEPLVSVNQIQVDIGMNSEDQTHKCKFQKVDNSKRTIEYIGNNEPGHFWYSYVIVKNIPEVPEDNFTQIIQNIVANRYQRGGGD